MDKLNNTTNPIHVGQMLKVYITEKRIFKSALARKIGKYDNEILRYQKSASLKSDVILALSDALQHNFFADIASLLPSNYTSNVTQDHSDKNEIQALELKIKLLEAEKAVLIEAIKR